MSKIMVVDDAAFMRMNMKNILEQFGHEIVEEAENGEVAVKKYKQVEPELVTMDITMPKKNGIEALKEIMRLDSEAKVVMCSAMGQQSMVIEAIEIGARDFIVKPFEKERIKEAVDKAFN